MSTTVTYKGNTLTTVNNVTKTLKTAGKYMEDDVVLVDTTVDLSSDTVTPATLMQGYTAHDASGAAIVGTASGGSIVIRDEADSHGGTIRHITGGSIVQGTKVITENGTYDVAAYADVNVSVPTGGSAYQDENGYIMLSEDEPFAPQGTLSITANGTYDVADYAGANVNVPPVGATNVVFGEFTASTAGSIQEVSVSYSGNGWPIGIFIFPKDGYSSGSTLYDTDHQYAIIEVSAFVYVPTNSIYTAGYGAYSYKSQVTGMQVGATRINGYNMFDTQDNPTSSSGCVMVRDKNGFAVSVSSASGSYGFLSGVSYKYVVIYSS